MKKIYQEPDVEFVSLVPQDVITDFVSGEETTESNIYFD